MNLQADAGAYFFHFRVLVDGESAAEVWGPEHMRGWVTEKVSHYALAHADHGAVTVERKINGEWSANDDWRKLAH